jgi:hypothetical protein
MMMEIQLILMIKVMRVIRDFKCFNLPIEEVSFEWHLCIIK